MASDEPNATWHPAFMPQEAHPQISTVAVTVAEPGLASHPPSTPHTSNDGTSSAATPAPPTTIEAASGAIEHEPKHSLSLDLTSGSRSAHDDTVVDAWFPEYNASSPWTEHAPADSPIGVESEEAPAVGASHHLRDASLASSTGVSSRASPVVAERSYTSTPAASPLVDEIASKHFSTISFTRTVPNDVNWDVEDDDAEWNISRVDTDPSQFIPPAERSNSFPVVPSPTSAQQSEANFQQQPMAATTAMNIIQEVDNEVSAEAKEELTSLDAQLASGVAEQDTARPDGHGLMPEHSVTALDNDSYFTGVGENIQLQQQETFTQQQLETPGARFEEGVPLITHETGVDSNAVSAPMLDTQGTQILAPPVAADPFAETADDDDFFSNAAAPAEAVPQIEAEAASLPVPPAIKRKSTFQVLQSLDVEADEEDSFFATSKSEEKLDLATDTTEMPNSNATDLADQWAAVLGDEDELLLDEVPETAAETRDPDPATFFGEDDEGFLEDDIEEPPSEPVLQPQQEPVAAADRYLPRELPAQTQQLQAHVNPYLPSATLSTTAQSPVISSPYGTPGTTSSQFPVAYGYGEPVQQSPAYQQEKPTLRKAQSFADKSKGGYSSPYDLPMDIVKQPRKRQSVQQLQQAPSAPTASSSGPLPHSSTMQAYPSTQGASAPPPPTSRSMAPPPIPGQTSAAAAGKPSQSFRKESFFEELPIIPKVRPASRHSLPSPSQASPYALPPQTPTIPFPAQGQTLPSQSASPYTPAPPLPHTPSVPPPSGHYVPPVATTPAFAPPTQSLPTPTPSSALGGLVAPPRASPYATLHSGSPALGAPGVSPSASGSTRYSPSPNQLPPPMTGSLPSRYSPAPPMRVPSAGYAPAATPPILPHQPRTSSPLALFEMSYEKPRASSIGHHINSLDSQHASAERRSSSSVFESRLNRVASLPPTREEEEESAQSQQRPASPGNGAQQLQQNPSATTSFSSQYSPLHLRQTSPPSQKVNFHSQATLSPPKRILNYAPHAENHQSPPRRSQTQSPGALYGGTRPGTRNVEPIPRPSSAHESGPIPVRPRAASQNFTYVSPTDGSETDPLQRWKGAPIFAWGVGGTFVSSFPQDVPRYGMNQAQPMIYRAAGEVLVKNMKEICTLDERQAKFPGPLKGKSKKKEVLTWLAAGIESLERTLPNNASALQASLEGRRLEERVLLWKVLHLFIEHDGVLEGNSAVDKAVRAILSPELDDTGLAAAPADHGPGYSGFQAASSQYVQGDAIDSALVEQIRKKLLLGDKETAVWAAVDKRLWGHAFLVAGAASPELFKKVAQEFVRKEVNTPGLHNESLAALYEVLSGNHEECVDELVPVHARAGLHLMTTQAVSASRVEDNQLAGLDKWRETLSLILSNRSTDDVQAIRSLGTLLSGYGRSEAAHVCFLFSRSVAVFGGLDDPTANIVLVGANHKTHVDSFAKDTDAILLSEVFEYGLSLSGGSSLAAANCPHLAAYKLQHAMVLAEYGLRDKALQYCEAIVGAINMQTRRSPYYHSLLESVVEDLSKRLKQAPREESNSWIPKPSMNKVSDTVWNRFNKFVAGDDNEGSGVGADGEPSGEIGPFSKIAGGTPTISRPPSAGGGTGGTGLEMLSGQNPITSPAYGNFSSGLGLSGALGGGLNGSASTSHLPVLPPTRAGSRYAPGSATSQPIPIPSAPAAAGLISPPVIHSSFDARGSFPGYTPLSVSPAADSPSFAPSSSPYEPGSYASPSYGALPSRRVASDQPSTGDSLQPQLQPHLQPTLRRQRSELSVGYSPYSPAPNVAKTPSLSRKSSYTPLSQAEPTPPVPPTESTSLYNPYAPSDSADNGLGLPGETMAVSETAAQTTPQLVSSEEVKGEHDLTQTEPESTPSYGYEPPSYGFQPLSNNASFEPVSDESASKFDGAASNGTGPHSNGNANGYGGGEGGYEPPSFQPYSYEPPSYTPDSDAEGGDAGENGDLSTLHKLKVEDSFDGDTYSDATPAAATTGGKSREEKDRENAELVRKIAEDEAKRAAAEKEAKAKKGWGITSWWGKKDAGLGGGGASSGGGGSGGSGGGNGEPPKAIKANLGEKSTFYFDPELKRWVNKNASPEDRAATSTPPPPPPRSNTNSVSSTPPPPPSGPSFGGSPSLVTGGSTAGITPPLPSGSAPPMMAPAIARTTSMASVSSGPPTRPNTSMGDASIDDLLGSVSGPRKAGAKKSRKSGRYVDVMAK
ncbi:vesicle coat component [Sporothrix epigloea]|uniref:Protein transport protein sec16 n=1 Tax=Sporothrix epigloea TaxID=1892477 RepID=A0ABP0DDR4_9PEZI